ncbi:MAG: class I SAM-dependent methyltransferase [bacterium]
MEPREFHWPMSAVYSRFFARLMEPAYAQAARKIAVPQHASTLLDIGGADGRLAIALARRYPHLTRIVTADISQDLVARARRKAEQHGLSGKIDPQVQDVHKLSYADNSFDMVISFGSLHHWRDPLRGLHESCRVLKPGGTLAIYDGNGRVSFRDIREEVSLVDGSSIWTVLVYWIGSRDFLDRHELARIVRQADIGFISISENGPVCHIGGVKQ